MEKAYDLKSLAKSLTNQITIGYKTSEALGSRTKQQRLPRSSGCPGRSPISALKPRAGSSNSNVRLGWDIGQAHICSLVSFPRISLMTPQGSLPELETAQTSPTQGTRRPTATCSVAAPPIVTWETVARETVLLSRPPLTMPRSPCQKLSLGSRGGIWNVEPECLPLISPVWVFRVLAFFPAAVKLGLCSPHGFLTCLPCFLTCVPSFHSEAQKPEPLLSNPRLPGRVYDAHFRFRSVPLRLRVLWVLLGCLICIRKTWRR